jgi:antitoxin component of RelBE/YafQ-DinJ toxin-antitoxin module
VPFQCRIEKPMLDKANKVTKKLGTSTPEMVRILVAQIARTGRVPLKMDASSESPAAPWADRALTLESFYDPSKTW